MDHKVFQELAVRTESVLEEINLSNEDYKILMNILQAHGNMVEILDMYKKSIFYGREIDYPKVQHLTMLIHRSLTEANFEALKAPKADKTPSNKLDIDPRIFHALLGTITEHGELGEALAKGIISGEIDLVNVCEELGDSDWYKALFYEATDISWSDVQRMIIKKLEIRFADKIFTQREANIRGLEGERKLLESHINEAVKKYDNKHRK